MDNKNKFIYRIVINFIWYSIDIHKKNELNINYKSFLELSLVCKSFHEIIKNKKKTLQLYGYNKKYDYYSIYQLNRTNFKDWFKKCNRYMYCNKSFYNFYNINELHLNLNYFKNKEIIKFISKFDHQNQNIISKEGMNKKLFSKFNKKPNQDILNNFPIEKVVIRCHHDLKSKNLKKIYYLILYLEKNNPQIEIEIQITNYYYQYSESKLKFINKKYSLENFSSIKSVSLNSNNSLFNDNIQFKKYIEILIQCWKVSKINYSANYNEYSDWVHLDYSFLFNIKQLKHINIKRDFLELTNLVNNLKENQDHIETLNVELGFDRTFIQVDDESIACQNSHKPWLEFCSIITNNIKLKSLTLLNTWCRSNLKEESSNERIKRFDRINSFASIFKNNNTLEEIGLLDFGELTTIEILKSILNNNNSKISKFTIIPKLHFENRKISNELFLILQDIIEKKSNFFFISLNLNQFNISQKNYIQNFKNFNKIKFKNLK